MHKTVTAFLNLLMNQFFLVFVLFSCFFSFSLFFFTYIKMSKNSSAKYYQDNKERLQKKLVKDIKVFLKKKKKKSDNMVLKDTKNSQKMKNKNWMRIEKDNINALLYYNFKKIISFRNFGFFAG